MTFSEYQLEQISIKISLYYKTPNRRYKQDYGHEIYYYITTL